MRSEERTQAWLDAKNWSPLAADAEWEECLRELADVLGRDFTYRWKTITQSEDPSRRFCTTFPDQLPKPYRFLDWIEFGVFDKGDDSATIQRLEAAAKSRGIMVESEPHEFWDEGCVNEGIILRLRGFKQTIVQQDSGGAAERRRTPQS